MIESSKKEGKTLYMAFLDIEKAYDSLNRRTLWTILKKMGLPDKYINLLREMYRDTKGRYVFGEIQTDWVKQTRGVRQGCVLSPLLFSLYTEELATRIRKERIGVQVGHDRLGILLYPMMWYLWRITHVTCRGL